MHMCGLLPTALPSGDYPPPDGGNAAGASQSAHVDIKCGKATSEWLFPAAVGSTVDFSGNPERMPEYTEPLVLPNPPEQR